MLYSCPWMAALVQDAVLALALLPVPEPGLALLLELLAQPASPALAVSTAIAAMVAKVICRIRSRPRIKRIFIPNERTACPPSAPALALIAGLTRPSQG